MPPPVPPQTRANGISTVPTTNELFAGDTNNPIPGPYGLGIRVPMIVISPWSKGGWVNSEVSDHTSLIQFIESRFASKNIKSPNITKWRRAVTGDLTSAFNFKSPNAATVPLPSTSGYAPPDNARHPDYKPTPPTDQALPTQEPGQRPARAVPYQPYVLAQINPANDTVTLNFGNTGKSACVFHVRSGNNSTGPWTYTVEPSARVSDKWNYSTGNQSAYDLSVYGPNGFFRAFKGSLSGQNKANLQIITLPNILQPGLSLEIINLAGTSQVSITDAYTSQKTSHNLHPGQPLNMQWNLKKNSGWYDFIIEVDSDPTFQQRIAGHIENGEDSMTDPAIAAAPTS